MAWTADMSWARGDPFSDVVRWSLPVLRREGAILGASVGVMLKVERRVEARLEGWVCWLELAEGLDISSPVAELL